MVVVNELLSQKLMFTDYKLYEMSAKEKMLAYFQAGIMCVCVGYIFYQNIIWSLILIPLAYKFPSQVAEKKKKQRQLALRMQFKEVLYSISSSLNAGKSTEGAFRQAAVDLEILYPDGEDILTELNIIIGKMEINAPVEDAIDDLAKRSGLEDVQSFADVLKTCKRTGGNLIDVTKTTTKAITDKLEMLEDIEIILAQKKIEQKIMTALPIGIVLLLSFLSAEYMAPLYQGIGRVVMTIALGLIWFSNQLAVKITEIKL